VRDEPRDDVIDRIVDELKTLPAVPAGATARVLARVDAARRAGERMDIEDDDVIYFPAATDEMQAAPAARDPQPRDARSANAATRGAGGFRRRYMVSVPAAIGYALAATLAGFLIRGAVPRTSDGAAGATTVAR
jgi:hypothetical protein